MSTKSKLTSRLLLGVGLSLALLAGCSTTRTAIKTHPDSKVNFSQYKSFQMLKPLGAPARDPAITPGLMRDMREATAEAFVSKGLGKSPDAYADLLVLVHGGLQDKLEVSELGLTYSRYGRGFGRQELDSFKEGSLYVDVFDAKSRELIWRGSAVAQVDEVPETAKLKETINTIVSRYPN